MVTNTIPQDPNNLILICDAARCYLRATVSISVQLRNKEIRNLNLCEPCRKEFFPNCRNRSSGNVEAILIDDKDVPLHFNTKTKCTCQNCDNEASVFLEVSHQTQSGYFCENCSRDLKLHGIAEEVSLR